MLLGVPGLTTRRKDALGQRCLPLGRRVCVPLVITGIPLITFFSRGTVHVLPTKRPQHMRISGLISQTYLLVPLGNGILGRRVAPLSSQYAYP